MTSEEQKAKRRVYRRDYRKRNPVQGQAACRRWRERNLERELARNRSKGKKYRVGNEEKQREYMLAWRKENSARIAELSNRRKARKLATQVDPAGIARWMKEIRSKPFVRCHWCGTKIHGKAIRFDHIIALARGGEHTISNLCATCITCNSSKSARAIADWICQGQTFLPL